MIQELTSGGGILLKARESNRQHTSAEGRSVM